MKVIMLKDVPKVGKINEIKEFSDGYANNVLISKGLAEKATPAALQKLAAMQSASKKRQDEESTRIRVLLEKLNATEINITIPANEKGHLFKSVNTKDILKEIAKLSNEDLDSAIEVPNIKESGTHIIRLKKGSVEGEFKVHINKK